MVRRILVVLSLSLVLAGCLQLRVETPSATTGPEGASVVEDTALPPTTMIHPSSMGGLESDWAIAEVPEPFQGTWRMAVGTSVLPLPPDYAALIFQLAPLPADCRVDREEAGRLREVGTMPYARVENGEFTAVFVGDFHLTYSLRLW